MAAVEETTENVAAATTAGDVSTTMAAEMQEKMTVSSAAATTADGEETPSASALQDNIARKGKNAYYFAHAHKANGPKWDGKAEPKLLMKQSVSTEDAMKESIKRAPSFHYSKSNITSYAFLNEDKVVKLYITMDGVGEKCTDDDIQLDYDEMSFSLVVKNFKEEDQCLSFGKLTAKIVEAKYKLKPNKIILTLKKEKEGVEWHTINDKGTPDHELV
mmetsp:Transcript_5200/g.8213  ORF Transcript_5200/g.8213 Transcript_5200/m.8213 type:complete len:217 (+) Transcript_5200:123-773(+)